MACNQTLTVIRPASFISVRFCGFKPSLGSARNSTRKKGRNCCLCGHCVLRLQLYRKNRLCIIMYTKNKTRTTLSFVLLWESICLKVVWNLNYSSEVFFFFFCMFTDDITVSRKQIQHYQGCICKFIWFVN